MKKKKPAEVVSASAAPIHQWFGLTYANYLVLQRTVLQSMPTEWQKKFVKLLEQANDACQRAKVPTPRSYRVQPVGERGRFVADEIPHYRHAQNLFVDH